MNPLTIQGFRVGMMEDYTGHNMKLRNQQKKLKKTVRIIRAVRCMNTMGKVYTEDYKKLRKHLTDEMIIKKYNEIREDLEFQLVIHREVNA
jgi:hypothetical protein